VARFLATGRISNLVSAQRRQFLHELGWSDGGAGLFDLMTLRAISGSGIELRFSISGKLVWYQPTIVNKF